MREEGSTEGHFSRKGEGTAGLLGKRKERELVMWMHANGSMQHRESSQLRKKAKFLWNQDMGFAARPSVIISKGIGPQKTELLPKSFHIRLHSYLKI